jgi:hypothetical protein
MKCQTFVRQLSDLVDSIWIPRREEKRGEEKRGEERRRREKNPRPQAGVSAPNPSGIPCRRQR